MEGIKKIYVWGRNFDKSKKVVASLNLPNSVEIKAVSSYKDLVSSVEIVSCITSSYVPLLNIDDISIGQHFDLAGSYTADMQEVSTDVVARSSVFTDNYDVTLEHAGELVKAFAEDKLSRSDIKGDFITLCKDDSSKRLAHDEITLCKCTGMAFEDFVFATLIYQKHLEQIRKIGDEIVIN
jgi:ornithine cyclodeaminase/alanine dehydrogenase-like protein (mu-crystallin family)